MALFNQEHYGKPISEKLSEYLKKYTDKYDRADVATKVESVGTSTIRDVVFRNNSITENNSIAIIELMKIAIQNCKNNIVKAKEAEADLKEMIEA